jgi:type IV secretory pathway TraG/TraD family ATPase VirD4
VSHQHRHATGPGPYSPLTYLSFGLLAAAAVAIELAVHGGAALDGRRQPTWNPLVLVIELARHRTRWPPAATAVLVVIVVVMATVAALIAARVWRRRTTPDHPDRAARLLARGRQLQPVSERGVRKIADRFGVAQPGLPVGYAVAGGRLVYASWEDMQTDIAGPRRLKTSARAIPTILSAPGAVFATSNKPDLYAATRLLRERRGTVWTLDPEQLVGEPARWWWNPLSYVTCDRKAAELTGAFVDAYRHPDAKPDPFFDPKGERLVEAFMRAAALDHRPLTDCYLWATKPHDETPARILQEHGLRLMAASVMGEIDAPVEQRGGVYGTAERILAFLRDPEIAAWCCRAGPDDRRPQLDLERFVCEGTDTLYLLSREGRGSQSGLVTALAMALCDAAETYARTCPEGRLPVPLVGVLDEAANICRWAQLPGLYTHYGSRGIPLLTLLQGWSQGVEVWGAAGMAKLWSAANLKLFGGGVDEEPFLAQLEKLIGDYNRMTASPGVQHGGQGAGSRSMSWQLTPTPILTTADLRALPRDRAIAFAAGIPPVLIRPMYWWQTSWAEDVQASIARYDPAAATPSPAAPATENPWLTPARGASGG